MYICMYIYIYIYTHTHTLYSLDISQLCSGSQYQLLMVLSSSIAAKCLTLFIANCVCQLFGAEQQ